MCECAETLCNIDFFTAGDKITSTSADTSTTNTGFSRQLPKVIFNFPLVTIYEHILKMNSQDVIRLFPQRAGEIPRHRLPEEFRGFDHLLFMLFFFYFSDCIEKYNWAQLYFSGLTGSSGRG